MKRTRTYKEQKQKQKIPLVKDTPQSDAAVYISESDERTSGNIASMHLETGTRRTGSSMRDRQADLEMERNDNGKMGINADTLGQMVAAIIKEISKEAGGLSNLSRSLVDNSISNAQMAQTRVDMDIEEDRNHLHENPEYKQQELNAALAVIKKTMKLGAADPFNRPVDPIALDVPDYFDVVKTPMDFGTICNNLENSLKYINSADVFKDVQYIWHNCLIYNKKGDHIVKLMMRVKTFFMKHWKAARLHTEQSPAIIDAQPLSESSILRHNQRLIENPHANNFTQLQKAEAGQPQQSSSQQHSSPEKDEPDIDSRNTQKKRQIHGLTQHRKLLMTAGKIKILTNELGQPVGPEAVKLTNFLGHTARDGNLAPLTYKGWSKMPKENKENMWQKVLMRFDVEPGCRQWVLLSIGSKWRNFKAHLKATRYDTHTTDEERLADRDERVLPDQWSFLVSEWSSDEFQKLSARNKANRAKVKFIHTSGTKSFARLLEEEKEKRSDGQELSQAELFILTRTRKNGQPVNEETAAVISKLRESATLDDAYQRVMGVDKKGGGSLSELDVARESIIPGHTEALKMVEEKNAELVAMKGRLASVEETCSQMAAQMSVMMSMMANMHKDFIRGNTPNDVPHAWVPAGIANHSEPAFASNHEVPAEVVNIFTVLLFTS
ncbi:hypothetical protein E3N88_27989 [Mikania micrantha]|uniref:Bromo domain-containing protein n=1 Tax=Mikania micrantha TaxID=192012 RepID=A0A5N6MYD4_9ASTR|nr:hypothetical protein E3N88_27989 [Mikania micrantha]